MAPKRKIVEVESDLESDTVSEEEVKPKPERKKRVVTKEKAPAKEKSTESYTDDLEWSISPPSLFYRDWNTEASSKIAAFDLDGTLVNVKSGMLFPKNASDWKWYNKKVEKTVKNFADDGYKIVVFSNQGGVKSALNGAMATKVKERINQIVDKLDVPVQVFCATMDDKFRKPDLGMWEFFLEKCNGGKPAGKGSFYVGDAAGRPSDFADSDRVFAEKAGLEFRIPEDVFGEMEGKKALAPGVMAHGDGHAALVNPDLVDVFSRLAELNARNSKGFQASAFQRVAAVLREYPVVITKDEIKNVAKLKGVGKGSIAVIQEFLTTGRVEALDGPAEGEEAKESGEEVKLSSAHARAQEKARASKKQVDAERDMALSFM